ncbi:hypothetical protein B0H11DRAFT_1913505 [Mycena galericulata]|nr:hypothetical protein B0H11DRAFT_1913505 [Mycena galericulata]
MSHTATSHPIDLAVPIKQFPTELLVKIFGMVSTASNPPTPPPLAHVSTTVELDRLANAPLRRLSRVCSQWHTVAMGTPSLWSVIQLNSELWRRTALRATCMALLQDALRLSGKCLLDITVVWLDVPYYPALDLFVSHAEHWRSIRFGGLPSFLACFALAKGRLGCLEYIYAVIYSSRVEALPNLLDMFHRVPRLKRLDFVGPPESMTGLPLHQLTSLRVFEIRLEDVSLALSSLAQLKGGADCYLQFLLSTFSANATVETDLPPLELDIKNLSICFIDHFLPTHCEQTLTRIFNLSFPVLENILVTARAYPSSLIPWPHTAFISLCARSSFETHLHTLELYDVWITGHKLVDCLSKLLSLQHLGVSDHSQSPNATHDNHLITNSLLTKLTKKKEGYLMPCLRSLTLRTFIWFDEMTLLALMRSRMGHSHKSPIVFGLYPVPPYRQRALSSKLIEDIRSLERSGGVVFRTVATKR